MTDRKASEVVSEGEKKPIIFSRLKSLAPGEDSQIEWYPLSRRLIAKEQDCNLNLKDDWCWKTMDYYRTRESNTQTTTSARRNY
jgi:hypothetical protein